MSNAQRFEKLKKELAEAKAKHQQTIGARNSLLKKLKEDWDCDSLKEAQAMLGNLRGQSEQAERDFDEAMEKFEEKWAEVK